MPLSFEQLGAVWQAKQLLEDAGLFPSDQSPEAAAANIVQLQELFSGNLNDSNQSETVGLHYVPQPATPFTPEALESGANCLTWKAHVTAKVEHPIGAIVEYPETGSQTNESVMHIFHVNSADPMFVNPRKNLQYSLGTPQGRHSNVSCHLLHDTETEKPAICLQAKATCAQIFQLIYFATLTCVVPRSRHKVVLIQQWHHNDT